MNAGWKIFLLFAAVHVMRRLVDASSSTMNGFLAFALRNGGEADHPSQIDL